MYRSARLGGPFRVASHRLSRRELEGVSFARIWIPVSSAPSLQRDWASYCQNYQVRLTQQSPAQAYLRRGLHSTTPQLDGEPPNKPSSKVESTATALAEKHVKGAPAVKRPLYKRVQDEILHYYHGFRLLFIDMKISAKLMWKILNGKALSRREHKQLLRTTSDIFRLVPFSVFIIVPFMELLLPVFLKLFPGMLPSTFQTTTDRETKMKAELKVKLEMAKFLQETLDDMAPQAKGRSSQTAKEFAEFIQKIRVEGSEVSNTDIMKFSKLFEDEITLDSLQRPQLLALCRVLEIPAYGTMAFLRFQLRMRLRNLAADDRMIEKEGVASLNYQELQLACKTRGMRAVGVTEERLRRQLDQWLQLSLNEKVPPSLLLLSRAMYLPESLPASAQLQATLSALPDGAALQTKAAIGEREGKVDNKTRIELIREEERKIKEEQMEAKRAREEKAKRAALEAAAVAEAAAAFAAAASETAPAPDVTPVEATPVRKPEPLVSELGPEKLREKQYEPYTVLDTVNSILSRKSVPAMPPSAVDKLTVKDLEVIENALDSLGDERKEMLLEKEELKDLMEEMADYKEDVQMLEHVVKTAGKPIKVNKGAQRLFTRLNKMIADMERAVEGDQTVKVPKSVLESSVDLEELIEAMRKIKTVEDDPAKFDRIGLVLAKLDDNKDGKIEVDDLVKVIEIVGRENVNMTSKQFEEIVTILTKEDILVKKPPASGSTQP